MASPREGDRITTGQSTPAVPTHVVTAGMIGAFVRDPTVFGSPRAQERSCCQCNRQGYGLANRRSVGGRTLQIVNLECDGVYSYDNHLTPHLSEVRSTRGVLTSFLAGFLRAGDFAGIPQPSRVMSILFLIR